MENLILEIRTHFASHLQGLRAINSLDEGYKAYTFRQGVEYGVAIAMASTKDLYEESAQITIKTMNILDTKYIVLACCDEEFRNNFAKFGAYFVSPGENGKNRAALMKSPFDWWKGWIGMLGNKVSAKKSYDTIAEMMALEEIFRINPTSTWTAAQAGTHDIESSDASYEIKSTVKKNETTVTISSRFQLESVQPLQLWFYRMEASEQGVSINDMKAKLVAAGYDENLLEKQLEERGFMPGNSIRDKKFIMLEKRKFNVDDDFPKIVESSFKNDVYPKNIIKILYTIDLEGIDYTN